MQRGLGERLLIPANYFLGGRPRHPDLSYGPSAAMRYDEYPAAAGDAPLVLFWHGGSWKTGHKEMYRFVGHSLQKMGTHAFVLDYPKYPEQTFPGFIDDARTAIAHISGRYPGRRVILMGHSAGSNTALLAAMRPDSGVDKVASIASVCTLSPRYWNAIFGEALTRGEHDPRQRAGTSPPGLEYLLVHGCIDTIVAVTDSTSLHRTLRRHGRRSQLRLLKLGDHMLILPGIMFGPLWLTRRRLKRFLLD